MSALFSINWKFIPTTCFLFLAIASYSQNKKELELQRKELNEKINLTSKLINKNQNDVKKQQSELVILDRQIDFRGDLIGTISAEIRKLDEQIAEKQDSLQLKEEELEKLKD
ncbi:MAG: hypothetical protein ACPF8V_10435, partial [Luteibaculum sp.]